MSNHFVNEKIRFDKLKDEIINLESKTSDEKKYLQDRLYRMIEYAIKRHDWYDEQKQKLLQIGIAILGSSAAFSAVLASFQSKIPSISIVLGIFFILSLLLTGLIIVLYYNNSIGKDHPYRKVSDIRSWYFIYNFPSGLKDQLSKSIFKARKEINDIISSFENFLTRWIEFANKSDQFIREDLEQVFILQIIQRYKVQRVKTLSRILSWGVSISCMFLILTFLTISTNVKENPERTKPRQQIIEPITSKKFEIKPLPSDSINKIVTKKNKK